MYIFSQNRKIHSCLKHCLNVGRNTKAKYYLAEYRMIDSTYISWHYPVKFNTVSCSTLLTVFLTKQITLFKISAMLSVFLCIYSHYHLNNLKIWSFWFKIADRGKGFISEEPVI